MQPRLLLVSSIAAVSLAPLAPLGGCSGDGGGGLIGSVLGSPAQNAMALLPESVKQSVEGYLSSVTSATDLLADGTQYTDLLALVPQLRPLIAHITEASQSLAALSPDTQKNVLEAFGPRLTDTNSLLNTQIDRLGSSLGLPPAVSEMLGGVNLFG